MRLPAGIVGAPEAVEDLVEVVGGEFVGGVNGAGEGAIAFLVEAGTDGVDGVGEEGVVLDVKFVDGETVESIASSYHVAPEDVQAALHYASELARDRVVNLPLGAT